MAQRSAFATASRDRACNAQKFLTPRPASRSSSTFKMRVPAAAEILRADRAGDSAVRQDEPGPAAFGKQLVSDRAVLAALERGLEQPRRLEASDLFVPDRAFECA